MIFNATYRLSFLILPLAALCGLTAVSLQAQDDPFLLVGEVQSLDAQAAVELVDSWKSAWENKDLDRYMGYYDPTFRSRGMGRSAWREYKRAVFHRSGDISVRIWDIRVESVEGTLQVSFDQEYKSDVLSDYGRKTMVLFRGPAGWTILREQWVAYPPEIVPPAEPEPLSDFEPVVARDWGEGLPEGHTPSGTPSGELPDFEPVVTDDPEELWVREDPAQPLTPRRNVARTAPTQPVIVEEIVAKVNDSIITMSELEERHRESPEYEEITRSFNGIERQEKLLQLRQAVLEDLINELLLLARASDLGVDVEGYVRRYLDDVKAESGVSTDAELEQLLEEDGMSLARFKERIRRRRIPQRLVYEEVTSRVEVTAGDVERWYEANLSQFQLPPSVSLSEIVLLHDRDEDASAVRKAAEEIYSRVQAGSAFEDMARRFSETPSGRSGGVVGLFGEGELSPEIAKWAFESEIGSISPPIRTDHGFHIMRLDDRKDAGVVPLDQVYEEIEQQLSDQAWNEKLQEYLENLYRTNSIVINEEYQLTFSAPAAETPASSREARR